MKNAGKITTCPECNKEFAQPSWKRLFCSRECALKACERLEAVEAEDSIPKGS